LEEKGEIDSEEEEMKKYSQLNTNNMITHNYKFRHLHWG